MSFLSKDLSVPDAADGGSFRLRPIAIHDAFRDDDAVMSSCEHPWSRYGEGWGRPSAALSLEQNCVVPINRRQVRLPATSQVRR